MMALALGFKNGLNLRHELPWSQQLVRQSNCSCIKVRKLRNVCGQPSSIMNFCSRPNICFATMLYTTDRRLLYNLCNDFHKIAWSKSSNMVLNLLPTNSFRANSTIMATTSWMGELLLIGWFWYSICHSSWTTVFILEAIGPFSSFEGTYQAGIRKYFGLWFFAISNDRSWKFLKAASGFSIGEMVLACGLVEQWMHLMLCGFRRNHLIDYTF